MGNGFGLFKQFSDNLWTHLFWFILNEKLYILKILLMLYFKMENYQAKFLLANNFLVTSQ